MISGGGDTHAWLRARPNKGFVIKLTKKFELETSKYVLPREFKLLLTGPSLGTFVGAV